MIPVAKALCRPWRERALYLEAFVFLSRAKLQLVFLPFRRLAPAFGEPQTETPTDISPTERKIAVDVSWAVQAVARHLPLGFVCLPQAMAAQRMLRRRGISSTLYLGVAPDRATPDAIQAHAWLRAGDKILTGEREALRHQKLASFGR